MKTHRLLGVAGAAGVLAVNAYITLRLFHTEYIGQMGSIEGAFIGLARYIGAHFPHYNWFPLWYGGIPFADAYPPLVHFIVAGVSAVSGVSAALGYHIVTAAFYSLGPVAFYWTAMQLRAGRGRAFVAALGYSLVSPACWLVPEVRADSGGRLGPRRLVTMVRYGEGPHVASLLFLVLSIGLLDRALQRRKAHDYVLAGLAMAATVLCNWIGAVALALTISAYLLAGFQKAWKRAWPAAAAVGVYAYAAAMPWVTPSTISTIRASALQLVGFKSPVWPFCLFAVSFAAVAWGLGAAAVRLEARFGILLTYGTAVLSLAAYWFRFDLLPQATRYHLEMDLAFWMAVALWPSRPGVVHAHLRGRWAGFETAVVIILAGFPAVVHQRRIAREIEAPIAIESTAEYQVSRWLGKNMPGRRVWAPGSISFWMDAFSDTPMLVGGFDNGIRNQELWDVNFQILAGDKPAVMLGWLRAFGCDAIVGADPESREFFHPMPHGDRMHQLPELWRNGTEVIYRVPRRGSLAHAVLPQDVVNQVPKAYETDAIDAYLAALENPALPAPTLRWLDPGTAEITADLKPQHLLSVQVSWDKGWQATVNGEARRIWSDKLGQVVIAPRCTGPCTVQMRYDGGFELRFAHWACLLALAGGALWSGISAWRRRSGSTMTS